MIPKGYYSKLTSKEIEIDKKLKPCPFCGGKPYINKLGTHWARIQCENEECECETPTIVGFKNNAEEAAERWNRRTNND